MVENATMIPEGVFLEERKVRFLLRQCTIRKHCPDLSKRISARYHRQWTEEDYHRMKQELENALMSDERVSLSAVAQQFGCDSGVLRKHFPDLCRAVVTRYRQP